MAILRIGDVQTQLGLKAQASIYNGVRAGTFPKPVALGSRAVGWLSHEVDAIVVARAAGHGEAELRKLVDTLHSKRSSDYSELAQRLGYAPGAAPTPKPQKPRSRGRFTLVQG